MSLRVDCDGIVPAALLSLVPGRFDVIGDIAIVALEDPLLPFSMEIARAIIARRKSIRMVVRKVTKMDGEHRVARFEILTGSPATTMTVHREYGFRYRLDIAKAFFAPRLASERRRVAGMVRAGEQVIVPFAGVGPFVIPAAEKGAVVTAIEKNPQAFRFLEENVAANGVASRTTLTRGDAFDRSLLPKGAFDRAIVPAPYGQDRILDSIVPAVKPDGWIHMYTFRKKHEIEGLIARYAEKGLSAETFRRCGNIAPGVNRWVFDLRKTGATDFPG